MTIRGALKEQMGWYEATLPLKERKNRGHFSTPPRLVEHILDACGYTVDRDLTQIRVLDPACGSGNFLAGATRRLASFAMRNNLSQEELAALISSDIWGFDPDPVSCFLADMQLRAIHRLPAHLHIHQADGLALPWDGEPCVDLFLANPPYLAAKNTDLSGYRSAQQRGQADSYLLFLNLGLQIVRPRGWLGLVLPDPLLARTNAARERAHLLKEFTIHHLWHLADVFAAHVGAVVIIAQKCPSSGTHQISWVREKWQKDDLVTCPPDRVPTRGATTFSLVTCSGSPGRCQVHQSLLLHQPRAELRYLLSTEQGPTIERLRAYFDKPPASQRRLASLSDFVSIRRGEELGSGNSLLIHEDQIFDENRVTCPPDRVPARGAPTMTTTSVHSRGTPCGCPGGGCPVDGCPLGCPESGRQDVYPVLRGGRDIRPYGTYFSGWWIAREAITKPLERYLSPKLLVVKSTDRLQAALDTRGHIALQTLYILHLHMREA